MGYRAAIFDLDGTLVDSLADLADSANAMLAFYGFLQHSLEEYRYFVGNGARKLMERCLPPERAKDPGFVDEALERYNRCYEERMLHKTHPYEGILSMLEALGKRGIPLAICTNKQQFAADVVAGKMFPEGTFREVIGDRKGMPRKPDPTRALEIVDHFGVRPENVAYLGDSSTDMETARNAGFLPIGVAWGFRPVRELMESGAEVVLHTPMELLEKVSFYPMLTGAKVPASQAGDKHL